MSDVPPDSGVLSSGIASPAVGIASPAVGGQDPRARIADLENIREKLEAELESANKVAKWSVQQCDEIAWRCVLVAMMTCASCYGDVC